MVHENTHSKDSVCGGMSRLHEKRSEDTPPGTPQPLTIRFRLWLLLSKTVVVFRTPGSSLVSTVMNYSPDFSLPSAKFDARSKMPTAGLVKALC